MTLEELYLIEKDRIKKLSLHYARMYHAEPEDLYQEGALAVIETYVKYAELPDEELLKLSHRIINRKMYKYAKNEQRHKLVLNSFISGTASTTENNEAQTY